MVQTVSRTQRGPARHLKEPLDSTAPSRTGSSLPTRRFSQTYERLRSKLTPGGRTGKEEVLPVRPFGISASLLGGDRSNLDAVPSGTPSYVA
jgi:hypothetical protein